MFDNIGLTSGKKRSQNFSLWVDQLAKKICRIASRTLRIGTKNLTVGCTVRSQLNLQDSVHFMRLIGTTDGT